MKDNTWFDRICESSSRSLAARTARRSFLAKLGGALVGAALLPLLPVARNGQARAAEGEAATDWNNPNSCDYWGYCSFGGWICSCCGGASDKCPPGTEASPIAWVGTCKNPGDGKSYVMSYHDCCGAAGCGECACHREEGATPRYRAQRSPYVTWCYGGGVAPTYMCTISRQLSVAE